MLDRQLQQGFRVLVLSVPLPTIRDGQDWGDIATARREIAASQADRTSLTLEYNERLDAACSTIGATFLEVTTPTLDPRTGLLRPEYYNESPTNHHLSFNRHAQLVAPAIASALSAAPTHGAAGSTAP